MSVECIPSMKYCIKTLIKNNTFHFVVLIWQNLKVLKVATQQFNTTSPPRKRKHLGRWVMGGCTSARKPFFS